MKNSHRASTKYHIIQRKILEYFDEDFPTHSNNKKVSFPIY